MELYLKFLILAHTHVGTLSEQIEQVLSSNNVFVVATRQGADNEYLIYTSVMFTNGIRVLGELRVKQSTTPGLSDLSLALKTQNEIAIPEVQSAICNIITA